MRAHRNIQPALLPFLHLPNLMSSFGESAPSRYLYPEMNESYSCFLDSASVGKAALGVKEAIVSLVWGTGAGFIGEVPFELV